MLQVALRAAWQEHKATGRPMLECYQSVGRVSGALANEADKARDRLPPDDQARLESIFVRLVRLGDTGGATRRGASLDEFDPPRRALLQKLGEDEYGRLVSVGATHAELAHEALITQWPWLQGMLKTNAADVRRLARLMERAKEWSAAPDERKASYLATGAERELFDELARQRGDWLSSARPRLRRSVEPRLSSRAREGAIRARANDDPSRSRATTIRRPDGARNIEAERRPVNAAKLALAAWPRDSEDTMTPKLPETLDALGQIVPNLRERRLLKDMQGCCFRRLQPGRQARRHRLLTDNTARVWDAETGRADRVLKGHEGPVTSRRLQPGRQARRHRLRRQDRARLGRRRPARNRAPQGT